MTGRIQMWRCGWLGQMVLFLMLLNVITSCYAQRQNPMAMNGGSVLAMAGDECVALAVDKRFGFGLQMVNVMPRHVLKPHPHLMIAFTGLEGDIQSLKQELNVEIGSLRRSVLTAKQREIRPRAMASLTSHVLFNRPRYVEPLVVGLEKEWNGEEEEEEGGDGCVKHTPFLCAHDGIGAQSKSDAFVCAGVASKSLYGTAEAAWRPGLKGEELARVCGKAFLSALERDALSGYGAKVYLMSKDRIVEIDLACRDD